MIYVKLRRRRCCPIVSTFVARIADTRADIITTSYCGDCVTSALHQYTEFQSVWDRTGKKKKKRKCGAAREARRGKQVAHRLLLLLAL